MYQGAREEKELKKSWEQPLMKKPLFYHLSFRALHSALLL